MAKKNKDDDIAQDEPAETSIAVNDAWTGMLAIALFALLVGTGLLVWDYMSYNYGEDPPKTPKFSTTAPKDGGAKN